MGRLCEEPGSPLKHELGPKDVPDTVGQEDHAGCDRLFGVTTGVGGDHDETKRKSDRLTIDWKGTVSRRLHRRCFCFYSLNQKPIKRGQVLALVNGRNDIKEDPSTQMMLPTVQQMMREFRNFVAQMPAIRREMI